LPELAPGQSDFGSTVKSSTKSMLQNNFGEKSYDRWFILPPKSFYRHIDDDDVHPN